MPTQWSAQQEAIFEWFRNAIGNLVVYARAGVGKSTTVVEGINYAPEDKILFCAFAKKNAEDLEVKIKNPKAEAKTLHSVGFMFVRRNWQSVRVDFGRGLRLARKAAGPNAPDPMVRLVRDLAAQGKGSCPFPTVEGMEDLAFEYDIQPDPEWITEGWTVKRIATLAINAMKLACENDGTIDYDDMVYLPVANGWVRGWWGLVIVDEAQDLSPAQLMLAQRACRKGGRIVVIGDSRQCIFGFRGANVKLFERLKTELNATELPLTITYRCPKKIVALAQQFVPDYQAAPSAPEGSVSTIFRSSLAESAQPGDFILSRKNAPLMAICLAILRSGKRAKVQGKKIGEGLLALIKKVGGRSMPDFLGRLTAWEEREATRLLATKKPGVEAKIDLLVDQADTIRALCEGLSGLRELEARIDDLFSDDAAKGTYVVCSSVHKAKGLEANRVFVLEWTLMRYRTEEIEEQNIEYVAITRTKDALVWVRDPNEEAKQRARAESYAA